MWTRCYFLRSTELVTFQFLSAIHFILHIACVCHICCSWTLTVSGNWLLGIDGVYSLMRTRRGHEIAEIWDTGMELGVRPD